MIIKEQNIKLQVEISKLETKIENPPKFLSPLLIALLSPLGKTH